MALPEDEAETEAEVGLIIPATLTLLGVSFIACVMLLAGLPPLSGFLGKFAMIAGALNPSGLGRGEIGWPVWAFTGTVFVSGFATLVALLRIGIQTFWAGDSGPPRVLALEMGPIIGLVAVTVLLTVQAQGVMRYMNETARALHHPTIYVEGVIRAPRMAPPAAPSRQAASAARPEVSP